MAYYEPGWGGWWSGSAENSAYAVAGGDCADALTGGHRTTRQLQRGYYRWQSVPSLCLGTLVRSSISARRV